MGFPTDFFPVLFSVPRVVGWTAHWSMLDLELPTAFADLLHRTNDAKYSRRKNMEVSSLDEGAMETHGQHRPRQLYIGSGEREYIPMKQRSDKAGDEAKNQPQQVDHIFSRRAGCQFSNFHNPVRANRFASVGSYAEKGRPRANKL